MKCYPTFVYSTYMLADTFSMFIVDFIIRQITFTTFIKICLLYAISPLTYSNGKFLKRANPIVVILTLHACHVISLSVKATKHVRLILPQESRIL